MTEDSSDNQTVAAVINHEDGISDEVIAVIGDGSLTGGMAYEALNNVGASKSKVIVILNDNGMSISPNTGGISKHLGSLRTSTGYLGIKKFIKNSFLSEKEPYEHKEKHKYKLIYGCACNLSHF